MDFGHEETDRLLKQLEKKIYGMYSEAAVTVRQRMDKYMADFYKQDERKRKLVDDGKLSESDYKKWRKDEAITSKWFNDMITTLGEDMAHVNETVADLINETLPDTYALNNNYGTYEIESGSGIDTSFTLCDRDTVLNLALNDPNLLPELNHDHELDVQWNKRQFNSRILNGILTGASIPKIANDVSQGTSHADMVAAIRNARTATTAAENAGRISSYERAAGMGIKMKQIWLATLDNRTRHSHAIMDGEERDVGELFSNGCRYPGDPNGDPSETYNCRCTLIAKVSSSSLNVSDLTQRNSKLDSISYEDWKSSKITSD